MKYLLLFFSLNLFAVVNAPISVLINAGSGITVNYQAACDSNTGICLTGNTTTGKYFQHLDVTNQTDALLSIAMTSTSGAPSSSTTQKKYAVSGGGGAWDDIAVFNNIYIRSEGASLATSGFITVSIW